jgi:integrase
VAPRSVGEYLERIRAISKAAEPNDRVFTNVTGKPAKTLYTSLIADLLNEANLREGTQGVPRSTYCFRHTYATLRLQEGVDVYFLAEQMGTSVHMIEQHYGHVNTIKHADRVLQGMAGWELPQPEPDDAKAKASKRSDPRSVQKRSAQQAALTVNLPKPSFAGAAGEGWRREGIVPLSPGFSSLRWS